MLPIKNGRVLIGIISVVVTLGITLGTILVWGGSLNARVCTIEDHQKANEQEIRDFLQHSARTVEALKEINRRLERIEEKLP